MKSRILDFVPGAEFLLLHAALFIFLNQGGVIGLVFHARKIRVALGHGQDGVHRVLTFKVGRNLLTSKLKPISK